MIPVGKSDTISSRAEKPQKIVRPGKDARTEPKNFKKNLLKKEY